MSHFAACLLCAALPFGSSAGVKELSLIYTHAKEDLAEVFLDFEKSNNVRLKTSFYTQDDLKTNLLKLMELNIAPDAVIIPSDHLGLHDYIRYSTIDPSHFNARVSDRVWESSISDGKRYGLPLFQGNHLMLYYNRRLVDTPAKDWETLIEQKKSLRAKGLDAIAWSYDEPFWFLPFLGAYGGWPIVNGKVSLNTPAMASALSFYKSLRSREVPYASCSYECTVLLFKAEKIAYTINGDWAGKEFHDALGDNLGIERIPMAEGKKIVPTFSTRVLAFPNGGLNGPNRDILIALGNHLQSQRVQQLIWRSSGSIPVEENAFKYAKENSQGYLRDTLQLMSETRSLPSDKAMTFVWDAVGKGFIRHDEGAFDSPAAAKFMQKLTERYLRNSQRHIERQEQVSER